MTSKKWNNIVVFGTLGILLITAVFNIFVDPFLHYHAPLSFLEYPLQYERYQNDGMARNYSYDSIITGSSMSLNFKCSEFDNLWNTQSVKLALSGATVHELALSMEHFFQYNPDIRYVLCSLDGTTINTPVDYLSYSGIPFYLYDRNPFNDVKYLLNKDVLPKTVAVINYTLAGNLTPDRDEYGNFSRFMHYGRDQVISETRDAVKAVPEEEMTLTEEDIRQIHNNIEKNYGNLVKSHSDTEFYFFIPPYSIYSWESLYQNGQLSFQIWAQAEACRILLEYPNVHVYDFTDRMDIITNLDNYSDSLHYGEWINSEILVMMKNGEGELKADNYMTYYEDLLDLLRNYDYSLLVGG